MCTTLSQEVSKKCACKFAHLCKERGKIEALQANSETGLNGQATFIEAESTMAFNFAEVNKHIHVQGDHI